MRNLFKYLTFGLGFIVAGNAFAGGGSTTAYWDCLLQPENERVLSWERDPDHFAPGYPFSATIDNQVESYQFDSQTFLGNGKLLVVLKPTQESENSPVITVIFKNGYRYAEIDLSGNSDYHSMICYRD
ncbi:MAG: hypothetical protein AB7T49_11310 [Oligoflexales bacterium]